ncbi:hypothetical protein [Mucilaginibacter sp.]|jgi:hypothetical protein|uniref:hypothetical protein n=1 Tax=Mucilaginibacter sp. TaxID=1882438 RepID=UPI0035639C2C
MKTLKEFTTEELKTELEARGYHTANLWQIGDVEAKLEEYNEDNGTTISISEEDKMEVLVRAFNNDATYSQIWESIEYELDELITLE